MVLQKICVLKKDLCANRNAYIFFSVLFIVVALGAFTITANAIKSNPWADGKTWIEVSIFNQCEDVPFSASSVSRYFESHGIIVYDVAVESRVVCQGCGCPRSEKISILVDYDYYMDVAMALAEFEKKSNNNS